MGGWMEELQIPILQEVWTEQGENPLGARELVFLVELLVQFPRIEG